MQVESKNKLWRLAAISLLLGGFLMQSGYGLAADNLSFKGTLVRDACKIKPGDETLSFGLDTVSSQYLYRNTRTVGKTFRIRLEGCDTSISDSVTTVLSGNENVRLPGLLALSSGSIANGFAIGIETLADTPLPLNVTSAKQVLSNGNNEIAFKAFIKAEPQAIANHSITAGVFTAVSTFTLNYP